MEPIFAIPESAYGFNPGPSVLLFAIGLVAQVANICMLNNSEGNRIPHQSGHLTGICASILIGGFSFAVEQRTISVYLGLGFVALSILHFILLLTRKRD
jgi:hypothetical protein